VKLTSTANILAASGAKVQPESDYASPTGLSFSRTYRSDVGSWGSIVSAAFIVPLLAMGFAALGGRLGLRR
jgi:hypothetical protein